MRHGGRHAVDARLPRASGVRRPGRHDGVPRVARLVDRGRCCRRDSPWSRRPAAFRPSPPCDQAASEPSSSTAATSSRRRSPPWPTPRPCSWRRSRRSTTSAPTERAVARAGAALPAQHAGVRPAPRTSPGPNPSRWSRSPATPRRCISRRRTPGSSASPWRCRPHVLTATMPRTCRESLAELIETERRDSRWGRGRSRPRSTPAVVPPLGWALSKMSQARFTTASRRGGERGPDPNADEERAVPTPETERGYVGSGWSRETFVGLQLCGQVEAQELTRRVRRADGSLSPARVRQPSLTSRRIRVRVTLTVS